MRLFLIALIIAALIQSSFLNLNLCLILIIARNFCLEDQSNLTGAFFGGLSLSLLTAQNLGFWAIVFLLVAKTVNLIKKLPFSSNILTILPVSLLIITLVTILESLIFQIAINPWVIIAETLLTLPAFVITKIWEERFIVKPSIKLKV